MLLNIIIALLYNFCPCMIASAIFKWSQCTVLQAFFFKAEFLKPKITKWSLDQIEYGEKKQFEICTSYQNWLQFW